MLGRVLKRVLGCVLGRVLKRVLGRILGRVCKRVLERILGRGLERGSAVEAADEDGEAEEAETPDCGDEVTQPHALTGDAPACNSQLAFTVT